SSRYRVMHATEHQFRVADETDSADSATDSEFDSKLHSIKKAKQRAKKKLAIEVPKEPYKCATVAAAPSVSGSSAASPLPATGGAGLPPLLSRFQLANQPSEDAIRSKRLVPYEVDSATVAWLLAHNQQLSPPVDQHGVGGKPTALVRPCRHTRSLGVQTDALSLDTSCLLEDFLRSSRAVGLLNSGSGGAAAGAASVSESAGAQSTADAEESAESLRNRCDELAKVNADLKRLLVAALGLDLQAQLDRLSSERAQLSAQLAAAESRCSELAEERDRLGIEADIWRSKFTAGRVMIDELAGWRARLRASYAGASRALDLLLQERQQLRSDLADTFSHLYLLAANQDEKFSPEPPANTLELSILNRHVSLRLWQQWRDLQNSASSGKPVSAAAAATAGVLRRLEACRQCTPGEAAAVDALGAASAPNLLADGTGRYSAAYLSPESKVCEQLALHSCKGCRGDTFVV
ncbi:hypothetical protein BOX15_Mlig007940g1, partial [Macrostomum lignano]